jgi:hypothetical protein
MLRRFAMLALLLMLAIPLTAQAQDLTETYTSTDGTLSFNYPSGWVVEGFSSFATIANSQEALEANSDSLTSGQVQISIFVGPMSDLLADATVTLPENPTAMDIMNILVAEGEEGVTFSGKPEPVDVGEDAAILTGTEEGVETTVILAIQNDGATILVAALSAVPGEGSPYRSLLIEITKTISYTPLEPGQGNVVEGGGPGAVAGTGSVVWQQQRPADYNTGNFGSLGELEVGADDTIYVADGYLGIQVLDASGNVVKTVSNPELFGITDLAVTPEGNFWVTDQFNNRMVLLDSTGTILKTFGELGTGAGQFGSLSPETFELATDGNLYVFDSQDKGDGTSFGRIMVFDQEGNFLREFPTDPNNAGELQSFVQMTSDSAGKLYLSDFFGGITVFDPQGAIVASALGETTFAFNIIESMVVDAAGSIYIGTSGSIYKLDAQGNLLSQFGTQQPYPSEGDAPPFAQGEFNRVIGIGLLSNGDVVVSDSNYAHSQIVRLKLDESTTVPPEASVSDAKPTAEPGGLGGAMTGSGSTAPSGTEVRQWASAATASSEFSSPNWAASQATGAPDTPACGDLVTAWASASSTGVDNLNLQYTQAVIPTQINIYQTYNPGAIVKVEVVVAADQSRIEIANSANPPGATPCPGVFTLDITQALPPVNGVIVYLDQTLTNNWNEIDAVELVGTAP